MDTLKSPRQRLSPCANLSVSEVHFVLLQHLAAECAAMIDDDVEVGPRPELALPVSDSGEGCDDQERPFDPSGEDLVQERDGLDGFPQTHLVSQDTVAPVADGKRRQK